MMRYGTCRMRGQALVMFVLVSAALVMVLGLAIDASGGWWKSQRQNDAIEIAKESALSRSNEIKFDATDSTPSMRSSTLRSRRILRISSPPRFP